MEPATTQPPDAQTRIPAQPGRRHQAEDPATVLPATATAPGYTATFDGRAEEAARARREITRYLGTCPVTEDMVLIASELAANAIMHTRSRGASFTIRCHARPTQARIEVEDNGGPWRTRQPGDRPHGLDIIAALTGPDGWGTQPAGTGGRIVWAELSW
jgi:serine/threonine-protein kinase RsbW